MTPHEAPQTPDHPVEERSSGPAAREPDDRASPAGKTSRAATGGAPGVKHDPQCEWTDTSPSCCCAQRAFLDTATEAEKAAFHARRGYDTNNETSWDLPPRGTT